MIGFIIGMFIITGLALIAQIIVLNDVKSVIGKTLFILMNMFVSTILILVLAFYTSENSEPADGAIPDLFEAITRGIVSIPLFYGLLIIAFVGQFFIKWRFPNSEKTTKSNN